MRSGCCSKEAPESARSRRLSIPTTDANGGWSGGLDASEVLEACVSVSYLRYLQHDTCRYQHPVVRHSSPEAAAQPVALQQLAIGVKAPVPATGYGLMYPVAWTRHP